MRGARPKDAARGPRPFRRDQSGNAATSGENSRHALLTPSLCSDIGIRLPAMSVCWTGNTWLKSDSIHRPDALVALIVADGLIYVTTLLGGGMLGTCGGLS